MVYPCLSSGERKQQWFPKWLRICCNKFAGIILSPRGLALNQHVNMCFFNLNVGSKTIPTAKELERTSTAVRFMWWKHSIISTIPNLPTFNYSRYHAMSSSHSMPWCILVPPGMVVSPALKNRPYYGQTVTAPLMLGLPELDRSISWLVVWICFTYMFHALGITTPTVYLRISHYYLSEGWKPPGPPNRFIKFGKKGDDRWDHCRIIRSGFIMNHPRKH